MKFPVNYGLLFTLLVHLGCVSSVGDLDSNCKIEMMDDAIFAEDYKTVSQLLNSGFPVNMVVDKHGRTLLHSAVINPNETLIKLLLDKKASLKVTDKFRCRPIDYAYEDANTNLCELLSISEPDVFVDGIPEYILETIFYCHKNFTNTTAVIINGRLPSKSLMEWFRQHKMFFYHAGEFKKRKDIKTGKEVWRDLKTGEEVSVYEVQITKKSEREYLCDVWYTKDPGPLTWFYFVKYRMINKYGYWFSEKIDSGSS